MRRTLLVVSALAMALTAIPAGAGPAPIIAQTEAAAAPYVVVMDSAPVLGNEEVAPEGEEPPDPESSEVEEYVAELEQEKVEALDGAGIDRSAQVATYDYAANGFSAVLTPAEAETLAVQKGVRSVQRDELRQLHTTDSPHFLGLDDRRGAWDSGYTGKGVIVGVIDTGIWPEHPSFHDLGNLDPAPLLGPVDLDPDPNAELISTGCDFGDEAHNANDKDFTCNDKLIGARDMRTLY